MIAKDHRGNQLVALGPAATGSPVPLTGALVVVRDPHGAVLLVHDVWRDQWELPGGGIESGESDEAAALREVAEEAGQHIDGLHRIGEATFVLAPHGTAERCALFSATITAPRSTHVTGETDAMAWWGGGDAPAGLNPIDLAIIEWSATR